MVLTAPYVGTFDEPKLGENRSSFIGRVLSGKGYDPGLGIFQNDVGTAYDNYVYETINKTPILPTNSQSKDDYIKFTLGQFNFNPLLNSTQIQDLLSERFDMNRKGTVTPQQAAKPNVQSLGIPSIIIIGGIIALYLLSK